MIAKVLRGSRVQGLIRYLYGPGEHGEHRDPHIVAGFGEPAGLEPAIRPDGSRDFRRLDGLLNQPLALLGDRNHPRPVWHVPVRAAPEDPILTDAQWAQIADEIMDRSGLARTGDEDAVRWIAVRHADDHIHLVATLARQDGIRPKIWNDAYRVRDACRDIEARLGLRSTAPADRTAARRPKRGETEKARRHRRADEPRTILRRHVQTAAASARTEAEFFARLQTDGIEVHKRFSRQHPDQVTGYAVALPDDADRRGELIWFGGGKLAADLTLPKLRYRWTAPGPANGPPSVDRQPMSGQHLSGRTARAVLRTTVRTAADQARTAAGFFDLLEQAGVMARQRFSQRDPTQITGYTVALAGHHDWYSAAKLAADLSWPRLQQRWSTGQTHERAPDLTPEERQAFYDDATRAASYATAQIRRHTVTNPHAARDACWAAADTLHTAAQATGNPHLRRAADAYDRAARAPYGQIPRPTRAGNGLRTAARLLAMAGSIGDRATTPVTALITNLVVLIDAIALLHQAQHRSAQATAARTARDHLQRTRPRLDGSTPWSTGPERTPSVVDLAMRDFPTPWAPTKPASGATTGPTPSRIQPPRRRAGPTL